MLPFNGCHCLKLDSSPRLKTCGQLRSCQAALKAKEPFSHHPVRILHFTDGCPSSLCVGSGCSYLTQETQGQVDSKHIARSIQVVEGKLTKGIRKVSGRVREASGAAVCVLNFKLEECHCLLTTVVLPRGCQTLLIFPQSERQLQNRPKAPVCSFGSNSLCRSSSRRWTQEDGGPLF